MPTPSVEAPAPAPAVPAVAPAIAPSAATQGHPGQSARTWSEADRRPFRYDGRWWAKASNGDVLVWDDRQSAWAPPLHAMTPFFIRRKPATSLQTPALWLYILFGIFLFVTVIALAADATLINAASGLDGDHMLQFSDAEGEHSGFVALKGLQSFVLLGLGPVFIWWLRRATLNLPSFGSTSQGFGGGWAIGAWFIPLANWVLPVLIVIQDWRGSDPALPAEENTLWKSRPMNPLIIFWWIAYLIGSGVWASSVNLAPAEDAFVSDALAAGWAGAVGDVLIAVAAILAIILVVSFTRRQEAAERRFTSISAQP